MTININRIINGSSYGKGNYSAETQIDLNQFAPVVAQQAAGTVSKHYKFIPTTKPLEILADFGWFPVAANASTVRKVEKEGYQKHIVRLSNEKWNRELAVGSTIPQIFLTNDHSGSAAFEFLVGLFEKICSNQLCVSRGNLERLRVLHRGFGPESVEATVKQIMGEIPSVLERAEQFKGIALEQPTREAFAAAAIELKFDGDKYAVQPKELLKVRHYQQSAPTLWNTYNVIQENLIRGGVRQVRPDGSRIRSRQVTAIAEDIRLNRALWRLTEELAKTASN